MSLDSFVFLGGALRGRRFFNGIRHPWCRSTLGTLDGAGCPRVSWESVAVPVANWMGVSSEQLATTCPVSNNLKVSI